MHPALGAEMAVGVFRTDGRQPLVAQLAVHGIPWALAFTPDTRFLIIATGDAQVVIWDFRHNRLRPLYGLSERPIGLAVSNDGHWIAATEANYTTRPYDAVVWNARSGRIAARLYDLPSLLAFSPDSTRLAYLTQPRASTSSAPAVVEVDLGTGVRRVIWTSPLPVCGLRYTRDGRSLLLATDTGAYLIDTRRRAVSARFGRNGSPNAGDNDDGATDGGAFTGLALPAWLHLANRPTARPSLPLPALAGISAEACQAMLPWTPVTASPVAGAVLPATSSDGSAAVRVSPTVAGTTDVIAPYPGSNRQVSYRLPFAINLSGLSPQGRFLLLLFHEDVHIDHLDVSSVRILDLVYKRLSPAFATFGVKTWWSADDRYLAVCDLGQGGVKFAKAPCLYCWDTASGSVTRILAAADIAPTWTRAGRLHIVADGVTCTYDPVTLRIRLDGR